MRHTAASATGCWPLALLLAPVAADFVIAAHVAMGLALDVQEDLLGCSVMAIKGRH